MRKARIHFRAFCFFLIQSDYSTGLLPSAKSLSDRADGILNNGLDNLMLRFEETQPDFFRDYTNARIIIDRPGGHGNSNPPTPPTPPIPAKT